MNKDMTVYEAAVMYKKMGYYPIPISASTKAPEVKFKDMGMPTDEQLAEWFDGTDNMIALRTVNHVCVDIDMHGDVNGFESFEPITKESWFVNTLTATTAGGGRHYIYMKPKDVKLKQRITALPGVDVKANVNNYHLVFPSVKVKVPNVNPFDDGVTEDDLKTITTYYTWDNFESYSHVKPPEIPMELVDLLKVRDVDTSSQGANGDVGGYAQGFVSTGGTKTKQMLELIGCGLGGNGSRNTTLTQLVGYLLRVKVDPEVAYVLCIDANNRTPNPLSENEFNTTFSSIVKAHFKL